MRKNYFEENREIHLYWFSGTGNTLFIVKEIKKLLEARNLAVKIFPIETTDPGKIDHKALQGFVIPVAGQGTYPFLWRFFKELPAAEGVPCFFVDTLAMYSGGILGPVKKILKKKGFIPLGAKEIIMPFNFQQKRIPEEKNQKIITAGKQKIRKFIDLLINHGEKWIDIPLYSDFLSIFFKYESMIKLWKKLLPYSIDPEKCTKCGICVRLCPVQSLMAAGRNAVPEQSDKCVLCHRCFSYCPSHAITIGNKNAQQYRAIELPELLKELKK